MWIKGKGDYGHYMVNTDTVKRFGLVSNNSVQTLSAYDFKGNGTYLMKFGEKSDGVSMIQKIGRLIARGCQYFDLETEESIYGKDDDPQEQ